MTKPKTTAVAVELTESLHIGKDVWNPEATLIACIFSKLPHACLQNHASGLWTLQRHISYELALTNKYVVVAAAK